MVRAADSAGMPSIVRVPGCQAAPTLASQLDRLDNILDSLGTGLNEAVASAVQGAVESVKFGPIGKRGLAGVRANRYGTIPLDHYVVEATETTCVLIQIETAGALNVTEAIAAERYVDLLFVGPNDLSQALGVAGHYDDLRYRAAVQRVGAAAREAGKGAGIMLRRTDQIADFAALGFHVFTASDRTLLAESARAWRTAVKRD
jgi:2-dehydro-3-deoxyglucarate aldolase/4-hydroxy-2-oxoheptanedioate aldolase